MGTRTPRTTMMKPILRSLPLFLAFTVGGLTGGAVFQEPDPQSADAVSEELARLAKEDQDVRSVFPETPEAISEMIRGDRERRTRVLELVKHDLLRTGADFYHAALILQHGDEADDYLLAHVLATGAAVQGNERGVWLSAAALDRYLMKIGQAQVFATQYKKSTGDWTQEPLAELFGDQVRAVFKCPGLSQARAELEAMNAAEPQGD